MVIVAIAWMYVVILMAFTQDTLLAGIATAFGYGFFPLSIVLYLMATPARRRRAARLRAAESDAREKSFHETQNTRDDKQAESPGNSAQTDDLSAQPEEAAHSPRHSVTPK